MRRIINSKNDNDDKTCDNIISNGDDKDDEMNYHLLVQAMMKNMEKCKINILSDIISIFILIDSRIKDSNNKDELILCTVLRVAVSLSNGCQRMPSIVIDRVLDPAIASETTAATTSGNSDIAISFRVLLKLIRNKWTYRSDNDNNRISWRGIKSNVQVC